MSETKTFNSIKDFLDPKITALLVWDVQNMLTDNIFNKEEFLNNNNKIIEAAHNLKIPVFFSKITPLPSQFESPVRKYLMNLRPKRNNNSPEGFELTIKPSESDIVINKNTASIFIGTNFEIMMRHAGIMTVIITGISTEYGVESSARDGFNRGFMPVIASDAVSTYDKLVHERSLENMKVLFPVMSTASIIENLK